METSPSSCAFHSCLFALICRLCAISAKRRPETRSPKKWTSHLLALKQCPGSRKKWNTEGLQKGTWRTSDSFFLKRIPRCSVALAMPLKVTNPQCEVRAVGSWRPRSRKLWVPCGMPCGWIMWTMWTMWTMWDVNRYELPSILYMWLVAIVIVIAFGGAYRFPGFCGYQHIRDPTWSQKPILNRLGNASRSCFVGFRCFGNNSCSFHFAFICMHAPQCFFHLRAYSFHFAFISRHFPSCSFHLY